MKHCNKCNRDLPEDRFGKNGNGSRSICKECQCERIKHGQRETRDYIQSFKKECLVCGYSKCKEALEFHHRDPKEKEGTLSRYSKRILSPATKLIIDNEMKKCDCLCANCHRELHSNEVQST